MKLSKRFITTLIASFLLSAILLLLERATESASLFVLQFPGFFAYIRMWGILAGPGIPAFWMIVMIAINGLVYWPFCFGLSFLFPNKSPKPRDEA